MKYDVVIIGGGSSALFTAMRLTQSGRGVAIISRGRPSTSMGSGEIFPFIENEDILQRENDFFKILLEILPGYELKKDIYFDVNGNAIPALGCPSNAAGISRIIKKKVGVVAPAGIYEGPLEILATQSLISNGIETVAIHLRLQSFIEEFYITPIQWAARMDDRSFAEKIIQKIKIQLSGTKTDAYIFPPILGIHNHSDLVQEISKELHAPVFEFLGAQGWPCGERISYLIEQGISKCGTDVIKDEAAGIEKKSAREISAVRTKGGITIEGKYFVIATGGLSGGGIIFNGGFLEPVFGLPVFVGNSLSPKPQQDRVFPSSMFWNEQLGKSDDAITAGIKVNEKGIPVNEHRNPVFRNLFACGRVISEVSRCAGGRPEPGWSALSGWKTAENILKMLSEDSNINI